MVSSDLGNYYLGMPPRAQLKDELKAQSTANDRSNVWADVKTILLLIPFVLGPLKAQAATYPISAGASTATIQSTINTAAAAPGGNTVSFAAGSYSITQGINIPCPASPLTITGPIVPYHNPSAYTATLNGSVAGNWGFAMDSCATAVTIEYLNWNGGEPSAGGGGFLYVSPGVSNLMVTNNFIHGNQANVYDGHEYDSLIWFDGTDSDPVSNYDNNDTVQWNIFGSTNDGTAANADCGAISALFNYQGDTYDAVGGLCAAIGLHSSTNNFTVNNNIIHYQEEGFKLYEGGSIASQEFYDNNLNFTYNDVAFIHRISVEGQQTGNPTMNFDNNDIHDQVNPAWGSWGFSIPQSGANNCENNVLIANAVISGQATAGPGSVEFWGSGSCSNNLVQGYWGAAMQYGFGGSPWQMVNNIIQQLANTSYINNEENITCCYPVMTGNVESQKLAAVTSAAPAISVASANSDSVTVTLTDSGVTNGGVGPQGNTTIYYTTDGSTPTTASTVCNPTPGSTSCSFSPPQGSTTVKAIGMWGAINQPKSYPSGYGFVPSAVSSATYSISGGASPTLTGVSISCASSTVQVGSSDVCTATCSYTGSITTQCTKTDAYGTLAFGWASSSPGDATISSAGLATGVAAGTSILTVQAGSFTSDPGFELTTAASPVTTTTSAAVLGNNQYTIAGVTYPGAMNAIYAVTGTAADGYNVATLNFYLPSGYTYTAGSKWDAVLVLAPTPNTQATSALCSATYTTTGTSTDYGWHALNVAGCGTLPMSTAYWVGVVENEAGPIGQGFSNCGGSCSGGVPTSNIGTYPYAAALVSYGVYKGMSTVMYPTTEGGSTGYQPSQYATLTTATTAPPVTTSTPAVNLGNNQYDVAGVTYPGAMNAIYAVTGTAANGYNVATLNFYLPTGYNYTAGSKWDVLLVLAPGPTTQATSALCSATYTTTGTSTDFGWHALTVSGCGTLPMSTAYWVGVVENEAGPIGQGFWDCGGSCSGGVPSSNTGTFPYAAALVTYGVYKGMSTVMYPTTQPGSTGYQPSQYATLTTAQ
jgi:hypothetical protein